MILNVLVCALVSAIGGVIFSGPGTKSEVAKEYGRGMIVAGLTIGLAAFVFAVPHAR
jgi:hypothetical protein